MDATPRNHVELCILFLYHRCDEITLKNFDLLRASNPDATIIPLTDSVEEHLPGSVDVRDFPSRWVTSGPWRNIDVTVYRWFENRNIDAERYILLEYDCECTVDLKSHYAPVWDADVATASYFSFAENPMWVWFTVNQVLAIPKSDRPFVSGLCPLVGTMFKHDALAKIVAQSTEKDIFCELRLATTIRKLGLRVKTFPLSMRSTICWHQYVWQTVAPGLFHGIKSVRHNEIALEPPGALGTMLNDLGRRLDPRRCLLPSVHRISTSPVRDPELRKLFPDKYNEGLLVNLKRLVRAFLHASGIDVVKYSPRVRSLDPQSQSFLQLLEFHGVDRIFDVGANVGQYAERLFFMGFSGKVVSFEPLLAAHTQLLAASKRNRRWLVAERCALGDHCGEVSVNIAGNSYSSSVLPMLLLHEQAAPDSVYVGCENVRLATLDSVFAQYVGDAKAPFLKMDVQGVEHLVLAGAANCLERFVGMQLEMSFVPLYEGQLLFKPLLEKVEELGFELCLLLPGYCDPRDGRQLQADGVFFRKGLKRKEPFN